LFADFVNQLYLYNNFLYYNFNTWLNSNSGTFIRASAATYYNPQGLLTTAASGSPRFDYDPTLLFGKGLLIEGSSTNLATFSNDFNNGGWQNDHTGFTSVTANSSKGPDGAISATAAIEGTINSTHVIGWNAATFSFTAGSTITFSLFVKPSSRNWIILSISDTTFLNFFQQEFNINTATVGGSLPTSSGTGSLSAAKLVTLPNGWYRISISGTLGGTFTTGVPYINAENTSNSKIYVGNGDTAFYLFGSQIEILQFSSSYIPTSGASVTRAADFLLTGNTANFNVQGTILAKLIQEGLTSATQFGISLTDGSGNNEADISQLGSGNARAVTFVAGVNVFDAQGFSTNPIVVGVPYKVLNSYSPANYIASKDGSALLTGTNASVPTTGKISFGSGGFLWVSNVAAWAFQPGSSEAIRLATLP
jgi:hypothetical protein